MRAVAPSLRDRSTEAFAARRVSTISFERKRFDAVNQTSLFSLQPTVGKLNRNNKRNFKKNAYAHFQSSMRKWQRKLYNVQQCIPWKCAGCHDSFLLRSWPQGYMHLHVSKLFSEEINGMLASWNHKVGLICVKELPQAYWTCRKARTFVPDL